LADNHEIMDVDVLFVGGGIASLSGALHLTNLIKKYNETKKDGEGKNLDEVMIAVLEKGPFPGAHGISGAAIDPTPLKELVPDYLEKGAPIEGNVEKETVYFLTEKGQFKLPMDMAPKSLNPLDNHGNCIVSVSRLNSWLTGLAEENGVNIFPEFPGVEVLYEGNRIIGVRTGDKGVSHDGSKKSNFEPGIDLHAKVTVFGEGSRGSLTKTVFSRLGHGADKNPAGFEIGVKEVWELPEKRLEPGEIIHTMGYPLKSDTFGGGFIYGMKENKISIGQLVSLDYKDPFLDPHREFQKMKMHPLISALLKDGKMVQYGAKTVPVSGYYSVPRLVYDGAMIIGDSANLFNAIMIKGVNIAMRSGMIAAETIFDSLVSDDFSLDRLEKYSDKLLKTKEFAGLYKSRNFHQAMENGLYVGMVQAGLQYVLGGSIFKSHIESTPDHIHLKKVKELYGRDNLTDQEKGDIKYDGKITYDKETDVYYSGATHEEDQPPHLHVIDYNICYTRCAEEYQNPCVRFCPAQVYEMEIDEGTGEKHLKLNFSNCVHCKTCDIKDPYENITWVAPEGGGGPKYSMM
jgi:electron-transferring-flavoprotein dehydrogenase